MSTEKSNSWRYRVLLGGSTIGLLSLGLIASTAMAGTVRDHSDSFVQLAQQGGAPADRGQRGGQGAGQGQMGGQGGQGSGGVENKVLRGSGSGQQGPGEDSDRPSWAGEKGGKAGGGAPPTGSGTKMGDLYGDLWVIKRDANGEPILYVWEDTNGDGINDTPVESASGFPQPIAADGSLIPLDNEGAPIDASLVQEVEFGRTSVARSPDKVLQQSLDTVLAELNNPTATITLDPSGRLVVDGATVDSPIENLALYLELMNPTVLSGSLTATLPAGFNPAALLAGAADKGDTIGVDYVVYLNSILGVNTVVDGQTTDYYDYNTYNYDRATTWSTVTATVLVEENGVYVPKTVNIYDTVFDKTDWTDPTVVGGVDDFAQATDDYLKVITYLHDNSAPTSE